MGNAIRRLGQWFYSPSVCDDDDSSSDNNEDDPGFLLHGTTKEVIARLNACASPHARLEILVRRRRLHIRR